MTIEMVLSNREREIIKGALILAAQQKLVEYSGTHGKNYDWTKDQLKIAEFYRIADWITVSEMCEETKNYPSQK